MPRPKIVWNLPPPPNPLPPFVRRAVQKQFFKTPEEVVLPDGFTPIYTYINKSYSAPIDGHGKLRKPNEQWWESYPIDGKLAPVKTCMIDSGSIIYLTPEGFHDREMCCAKIRESVVCDYPKDKCPHNHCGAWSPLGGVVCKRKKVFGRNRCEKHGGLTPRGADVALESRKSNFKISPVPRKWSQSGYVNFIDPLKRELYEGLVRSGADTDLTHELHLSRLYLFSCIAKERLGDSKQCWLNLKDAWNSLVNSKGEDDTNKWLSEIGRIIQNGLDAVTSEEATQRAAERTARIAKIQQSIVTEKHAIITRDQVTTLFTALLGLVTEKWQGDFQALSSLRTEMVAMATTLSDGNELGTRQIQHFVESSLDNNS